MVTNQSAYTSDRIRQIVRGRNFFDDLKVLAFVLDPIRETVLALEGKKVTLGDCYFHLARLGATIKKFPRRDNLSFYNHCISKMNARFEEFNDDKYLLCFFLNPHFRSMHFYLLTYFLSNKH